MLRLVQIARESQRRLARVEVKICWFSVDLALSMRQLSIVYSLAAPSRGVADCASRRSARVRSDLSWRIRLAFTISH